MGFLKNKAVSLALLVIKEKVVNPNLEGIGTVREISYKDGKIYLTIILEGLEDHPMSIEASDIEIANDASTIKVNKFKANKPFLHNALNRFAVCKFDIPESSRTALKTAKTVLGL